MLDKPSCVNFLDHFASQRHLWKLRMTQAALWHFFACFSSTNCVAIRTREEPRSRSWHTRPTKPLVSSCPGRPLIFNGPMSELGDPGWIRTIDLPLRRRPLYPLSYGAHGALHAGKRAALQAARRDQGLGNAGKGPERSSKRRRGSRLFGPPLPLQVHRALRMEVLPGARGLVSRGC